jgi:phosphoenolpyruvate carboxykinase (ATP)
MPPIARMNKEQAMYYFLSGYTSKLAELERGIVKPEATLVLVLELRSYHGHLMLMLTIGRLDRYSPDRVYLLNTGWTGGSYGVGNRYCFEIYTSQGHRCPQWNLR